MSALTSLLENWEDLIISEVDITLSCLGIANEPSTHIASAHIQYTFSIVQVSSKCNAELRATTYTSGLFKAV